MVSFFLSFKTTRLSGGFKWQKTLKLWFKCFFDAKLLNLFFFCSFFLIAYDIFCIAFFKCDLFLKFVISNTTYNWANHKDYFKTSTDVRSQDKHIDYVAKVLKSKSEFCKNQIWNSHSQKVDCHSKHRE